MTTEAAMIIQELADIKRELGFVKHILTEDYSLSVQAKKALAKARASPRTDYVSQEEIERQYCK